MSATEEQLIEGIKAGDAAKVTEALELEANIEDNEVASQGMTPLMVACEEGKADIVKLLIDKGANVNAKQDSDQTPLMYALWQGDLEIVKQLVKAGADINAAMSDGRTPLSIAKDMSIDALKAVKGM